MLKVFGLAFAAYAAGLLVGLFHPPWWVDVLVGVGMMSGAHAVAGKVERDAQRKGL